MKKEQTENKWLKILEVAKEYIIPLFALVVGASITYANLNNRLVAYASVIDQLEIKQQNMENTENIILQRLSSIDAKLEYIISTLDKLE